MEALSDETWDVVIAGTSLPQSLLALALSKTGLKVLHVDRNDYYGGIDAGLSLDEAEKWSESKASATIVIVDHSKLSPSRSYTISLNPQIVFAKSQLLPALVSSQIHAQLEFQAVGPFFVLDEGLQKIPSNREDVFADDSLSDRDKRRLMKLLRYALEDQNEPALSTSLAEQLTDRFKLPASLWPPVQALTLSTDRLENTPFDTSIARLRRQLTSMGYFGPGLAAVMAKYGGNAELCQVACRACAVGGGVYLLGHSITSLMLSTQENSNIQITLTDGTKVEARHVVGMYQDLPIQTLTTESTSRYVFRSVSIISQPLRHLFTPASEDSPVPAVAIISVDDKSNGSPIFLQVHSEDTGECPQGQCLIYASTISDNADDTQARLASAVEKLIKTTDSAESDTILWTMSYNEELEPSPASKEDHLSSRLFIVDQGRYDIACDDGILDAVKSIWQAILGEKAAEYDFLRFEERKDEDDLF